MNQQTSTNFYFVSLVLILFIVAITGVTIISIDMKLTQPQKCVQLNELQTTFEDSNIIQNQIAIANYLQAESQCLTQIKKCQLIEDNNTSFTLGCFK